MKRRNLSIFIIVFILCITFSGCGESFLTPTARQGTVPLSISEDEIPEFSESPYIVINNNVPSFTEEELTTESYEFYSELDELGRCGVAMACIGSDLMPTEERGSIGQIKPSGWQMKKYDIVDGGYLYNRCHLIGFQLAGENANEKNLITGTKYMNVDGMLPFEDMVADYVKESGNHCMYRVTPVFRGDNLVASGVQIEAYSVEDSGAEISFNVYCYNNQPGITINYGDGDSWLSEKNTDVPATTASSDGKMESFVLNTSSKKFHSPECSSVDNIKDSNKEIFEGYRQNLIDQGYEACGSCKP